MLGTAHREEDESGEAEIDSYNNIPKLFLRGRIWVHLTKYVFVPDFLKCLKMFWPGARVVVFAFQVIWRDSTDTDL